MSKPQARQMTETRPLCELCEALIGPSAFNDPHPDLVLTVAALDLGVVYLA
jgi:hypothetical protein